MRLIVALFLASASAAVVYVFSEAINAYGIGFYPAALAFVATLLLSMRFGR